MIETLEIENFRSFRSIHLTGLKPINFVVGDNGVGKTAFLEALYFAMGPSPEIGVRLRLWRGLEMAGTAPHAEIYDSLWADFFCDYDRKRRIGIELHGTRDDSRSLQAYYNPVAPITLPLSQDAAMGSPSYTPPSYIPVTFEWKAPGSPDTTVTPLSTPSGLQMPSGPVESNINAAFVSAHFYGSGQTIANIYSSLSKTNKDIKVIEALSVQFPEIRSLSIEIEAGAHTLFASISGMPRKIPLANFSNGALKLVAILLHIANLANGIVLIDEIENGFHHTRYQGLWSQIFQFSNEFGTQIFASTHSLECLRGALPLLEKYPDEFSLIQIFQRNGVSQAAVVRGSDMSAAIAHDIEVRA